MNNLSNKLVLGTVQFGKEYGINNFYGEPARESSLAMLDLAFRKGIYIFDTAYEYGYAEEILGEFLKIHATGEKIKIITKLKPNILSENKGTAYDIILTNLKESLKRLQRDYVDGYLLHSPEYVKDSEVVDSLSRLKKLGLVKNIGVSIYEEEDALYAANLAEIDYIQIPYNIFDQRLSRTDFFKLAKENGKKVFARSAFLQGLILMEEKNIPSHLEGVKVYLRELDNIINKYNLSRRQAALLFSLKNKDIDYVVFGAYNIKQLEENIDTARQNYDCDKCMEELKNKFIGIERNIILPFLWKKSA